MKKRNGFTLIELLGVIVILTIILAIVIINLKKVSDNVKDNSYIKQTDEVVNAAKDYFTTNNNYLTDLENNKSIYVSLGTLVKEDYLNKTTSVSTKKFNECDIVLADKKNGKLTYTFVDKDTAIYNNIFIGNNCNAKPTIIDSVVINTTKDTTKKTNPEEEITKKTTSKSTTTTAKTTPKTITKTTTKTTTKSSKKTTKETCLYSIVQHDEGKLYSLKIKLLGKNVNNFYYVVWNKNATSDTTNKKSGEVNDKCKLTDTLKKSAKKTGTDLITDKISMLDGTKNQYYCFAVKPVSKKVCNSWKVQYKHAHLY